MSIFEAIMTKQQLKELMRPCNNRNYGGYYALIILSILTVALVAYGLYKLLSFLGGKAFKALEKRAQVKKAQVAKTVAYDRLRDFEQKIFFANNKLNYVVRSYKNTKQELEMYVDFYLKNDKGMYDKVTDELYKYLKSKVSYGLIKYNGKKDELKDTILIKGLGQLFLENALGNAYGNPVEIEYLDEIFVGV